MLINQLPPLDWIFAKIDETYDSKVVDKYNPLLASVLTIALPIFEAYEVIYNIGKLALESLYFAKFVVVSTVIIHLKLSVMASSYIIHRFGLFTLFQQYSKIGAIIAISLGIFIYMGTCGALSTGLTGPAYLGISLYHLILSSVSIYKMGEKRNLIYKEKFQKVIRKIIFCSVNIILAPVYSFINHKANKHLHLQHNLIGKKPSTFEELQQVTERIRFTPYIERLADKKRCYRLIRNHMFEKLNVPNIEIQHLGFMELMSSGAIGTPYLINYISQTLPGLFKEIIQLRMSTDAHLTPACRGYSVNFLSYFSDFDLHLTDIDTAFAHTSCRKEIRELISKHPQVFIYEALGTVEYKQDTSSGKIIAVKSSSEIDRARWTFLKWGLRQKNSYTYLNHYPYLQSKLKEMHQIHDIKSDELDRSVSLFTEIINNHLAELVESNEAVEAGILLNDKDLLNTIAETYPRYFQDSIYNLIIKYPEVKEELRQVREEAGFPNRLFNSRDITSFNQFCDLVILN